MRLVAMSLQGEAFEAVVRLFCAAFPGSDPLAVAAQFRRHAGYPGYRGLVALEGETPVGLAYGYTSLPGQPYHDKLRAGLGPGLSERWLTDCFEFVELGVAPARRRAGIGRRLHDALLARLPHATSVLTTQVSNTAARRLYAGKGWQVLLEPFWPDRLPYVIMGRDLRPSG